MPRRIIVTDDDIWGEIVKAWATGAKVLQSEARPVPPIPTTPEELKQLWHDFKIGPPPDGRITRVEHVQPDANTLLIRIPAKELVEEFERELRAPGGKYEAPDFYNVLWDHVLELPDPEQRVRLQKLRIGDYSIGMCM
jgi:hypothetical protein